MYLLHWLQLTKVVLLHYLQHPYLSVAAYMIRRVIKVLMIDFNQLFLHLVYTGSAKISDLKQNISTWHWLAFSTI